MTLASAARHLGKKSIPEEGRGLEGESLYRESQHHFAHGGILSSLATSGKWIRVCPAPGGELDLIFLSVGHFWPLFPLLTAECGDSH